MFDDDPFAPFKPKAIPLALQLENASVEELEKRIFALKAEISECEAAIVKKKAQRSAADSLFGGNRS
jgi:uncharacterized small protein (DUF1192 family)